MDLMVCPYDPLHKVECHRMPYHLIKCKKNYKGPPLDACPFNVMHLVPKGTLPQHFSKCEAFYNANREKLQESLQSKTKSDAY